MAASMGVCRGAGPQPTGGAVKANMKRALTPRFKAEPLPGLGEGFMEPPPAPRRRAARLTGENPSPAPAPIAIGSTCTKSCWGRYLDFSNSRRPHSSLGARTPEQACLDHLPQVLAAEEAAGATASLWSGYALPA